MAKKKGKSRARAVGRFIARGGKTSAVAAVTGVASEFVGRFASEKVEMLRDEWYVLPAVMAASGHFLRRKNEAIGLALLGAAGYAGALNYGFNKASRAASGETEGVIFPDEMQAPHQMSIHPLPQGPMATAEDDRVPSALAL